MSQKEIKKFVRGIYYALFFVLGVLTVYGLAFFIVDTWSKAWDIYVSILIALGLVGLVQLGVWAFQEPKNNNYKGLSDFPAPERKRDKNGKFIYE